ncbi:MAG: hypothetical protein [crAssphage sp. isolate ctcc615]|uniref:Uncharacterized protein n=1 Tax=crAssphage sp. isolate ctcc615 TaxID=2989853 RepID=A0A345BNX3_9CAUD|nr:MAG: hypothetical protein KNU00_gp43 [crAssphage sp. isolate ctcc615]AXF52144.1 MAG: hypothetical protein [crAssphage sp. isolate ctcc615]
MLKLMRRKSTPISAKMTSKSSCFVKSSNSFGTQSNASDCCDVAIALNSTFANNFTSSFELAFKCQLGAKQNSTKFTLTKRMF